MILECSKTRDDLFGAVYWGVRAYCCQDYYPMNEQLLKYLEEARLAYLEMLEREWLDVNPFLRILSNPQSHRFEMLNYSNTLFCHS